MKKLILASYALLCTVGLNGFAAKSFLLYRSQAVDIARSFVGWQQLRVDLLEGYYAGNATFTLDYTRSFDAKALSCFLFGGQSITFSGSRVAHRAPGDILADYFGLPTDFQSTVWFKPRIENVIADFDWYGALHYLCEGLYVRVSTTLVRTDFDLRPCEHSQQQGRLNYPAGYMASIRIDREQLAESALYALSGGVTFGDLDTPLAYGKITGKQTLTKLADIYLGIGYLFASDDEYHIAGSVHAVVPTGTRSKACFLFEPQIGNGHHWAVGVGLNAHYGSTWYDNLAIGAYFDMRLEHLFSSHQKRSFDLLGNGSGSRYMLLQEMGAPLFGFSAGVDQALGAVELEGSRSAVHYSGRIFNAINKTTFDTKIKIPVQADIALSCVFECGSWQATIGYNLWARSAEKLVCREPLPTGHYALKGDAQLYGYQQTVFNPEPLFVGLNATQHTATLHAGQAPGSASEVFSNTNADSAAAASFLGAPLEQSTVSGLIGTGVTVLERVYGSAPAQLLSDADINVCSGLSPKGLSNSIFAYVGYTWYEQCGAIPYVGIGTKVECGRLSKGRAAVSQWGLWIKGGITY